MLLLLRFFHPDQMKFVPCNIHRGYPVMLAFVTGISTGDVGFKWGIMLSDVSCF